MTLSTDLSDEPIKLYLIEKRIAHYLQIAVENVASL